MKLLTSQPHTNVIVICSILVCASLISASLTREGVQPNAAYYYADIAPEKGAENLAFDNIESALRHFEFDPQQPQQYGSSLESTLREASEEFTQPISDALLNRIDFLASKMLPADTGKIFTTSFPVFVKYVIAEKEFFDNSPRPENIQEELAQFDELSALRLQYLGESLNHLLYHQQSIFTHNLLSRRAVQSDDSLSEEEKQQRLQELQEALRKAMTPEQ